MFILQNSEPRWMPIVSLPILFPNLLSMSLNTPQWSSHMENVMITPEFIKRYRSLSEDEKLALWLEDFHDNEVYGYAKWPINLSGFAVKIEKFETKEKFMREFIPPIVLAQKYYHLNYIFMTTKKERKEILKHSLKYLKTLTDPDTRKLARALIVATIKDSTRLPKELNSDQEEWCRQGLDLKYLDYDEEMKQGFWNGEIWYKFQNHLLPISLTEYRKTAEILKVSKKEFDQFILGIFEFFASQGHPKRFEEIFIASPEETKYWNDELDTLDQVRQEVRSIVPPEEKEER